MRRALDVLVLVGFAAVSAALGALHPRLAVDVENVAMSSDRTAEAAVAARRDAAFEPESALVLLLEPDGGADDAAVASAWLDAVAGAPGVRAARALPVTPSRGGILAAADLAPAESGAFLPAHRSALAAARAAVPDGWRLAATGPVAGQAAISDALRSEEARVLPALIAVLALVLALTYRSASLVVAAFLPAAGAVVWIGGLQVLLGLKLDPISTLLQPTLLTVGVAGAVHVLEGYLAELEVGVAPAAAPAAALRHVRTPAVLALLTTVAGFLGLTRNEIPAVRTFGWVASAGVAVACGLTLVLVPAWLRLTRPRVRPSRGRTWRALSGPLTSFLERRARALVALSLLLGLVAVAAWTRVRVGADPLRLLPPAHPFRVESARIADELGGFETFELLLGGPSPQPAPLALARLAGGLARVDGVAGLAGAPRRAADGTYLVPALLALGDTEAREATFAAAEAEARALGWRDVASTGLAVRMTRDSERLVTGQLRGLGVTAALITGVLVAGLRSVRLGLLGMVPNLLPCCLLYGGMAALGRPLTVATAMIGTVFLGLVVDDSVHELYLYRRARVAGASRADAVATALRRAGRAISVTSVALCAGFAACWSGRMETTREFGALAAAIVAAAFATNLVVLPALLLVRAPGALPTLRAQRARSTA